MGLDREITNILNSGLDFYNCLISLVMLAALLPSIKTNKATKNLVFICIFLIFTNIIMLCSVVIFKSQIIIFLFLRGQTLLPGGKILTDFSF